MNLTARKHIATVLLISSFCCSVLFVLSYRLQDGFELVRLGSVTALFDIAGQSTQMVQTTVIVGYLLGLVFLFTCYADGKRSLMYRIVFVLTIIAIAAETIHLIQGLNGTYQGGHVRVGLLLTLMYTWIYFKINGWQTNDQKVLSVYDDEKQLLD